MDSALIDPERPAVDIVQAIGRGLRQTPGQHKLATLVVQIFVGDDETEADTGDVTATHHPTVPPAAAEGILPRGTDT